MTGAMLPRVVGARVALGGVLMAALVVTGCSAGPPDYCSVVKDEQAALTEAKGDAGLMSALAPLRRLAAAAPDDIADSWAVVLGRVDELSRALSDAGVDPATYDPKTADITAAQRSRIEEAAAQLLNPATTTALAAIEQQALDVCGTPLSL